MTISTSQIIDDFLQVAKLAGLNVTTADVHCENFPAPHTPPNRLPPGKMAVYVFVHKGQCLKVGKVGPNSQARYTSQHYNAASSNSNLAKSLLSMSKKDALALGLGHFSDSTIGDWIKKETDRMNFLVDEKCGMPVLSLLEVFLQCRFGPIFEGFESQR